MRIVACAAALVGACSGSEAPEADTDLPPADTDADACDAVGVLCVVAGVPGQGGRPEDGMAAMASTLYAPEDVEVDGDGTRWWIADANNHVVREVGADGVSHVVLGTGFPTMGDGGPGATQPVSQPSTLLYVPGDGGRLWLTCVGSNRIGRLELGSDVFSLPYGSGAAGSGGDDGPASQASFWRPTSTAFDAQGRLYVADRMNQVIRRIDTQGVITTIAGQTGVMGFSGDEGPATDAELSSPPDSEMDPGNRLAIRDGRLVFADTGNHAVRAIDLETGIIDTLAGGHGRGHDDDPEGDGDSRLDRPHDVAIDEDGTVYVADTGSGCVRAIAPSGVVSTIAGQCGVPGPAALVADALDASLDTPSGLALDTQGRLWIADTHNHVVRRVRLR